jgi:hypothetical protein
MIVIRPPRPDARAQTHLATDQLSLLDLVIQDGGAYNPHIWRHTVCTSELATHPGGGGSSSSTCTGLTAPPPPPPRGGIRWWLGVRKHKKRWWLGGGRTRQQAIRSCGDGRPLGVILADPLLALELQIELLCARTVSHLCAWIGPPCLRQCVHGALIGGGARRSPQKCTAGVRW